MLSLASIADISLVQTCIFMFLALSVAITLITLDFPDLSIEGTYPFGAAIVGVLIGDYGMAPILATSVAVLGGLAAGAVTGILHVKLRMSKLLSGISVAAMLYSGSLLLMSGRANISLLNSDTILTAGERLDKVFNAGTHAIRSLYLHPGTLLILLILAGISALGVRLVLASEFGVGLRATGCNETALIQFGRSPGAYKIAGLSIANGLAALGGSVAAQHQGFADVNMGIGILVSSLVAVILGREVLNYTRNRLSQSTRLIASAVVGVFLYQTIFTIVLAAGAPPTSLRFLSGAALVGVAAIARKDGKSLGSW